MPKAENRKKMNNHIQGSLTELPKSNMNIGGYTNMSAPQSTHSGLGQSMNNKRELIDKMRSQMGQKEGHHE